MQQSEYFVVFTQKTERFVIFTYLCCATAQENATQTGNARGNMLSGIRFFLLFMK